EIVPGRVGKDAQALGAGDGAGGVADEHDLDVVAAEMAPCGEHLPRADEVELLGALEDSDRDSQALANLALASELPAPEGAWLYDRYRFEAVASNRSAGGFDRERARFPAPSVSAGTNARGLRAGAGVRARGGVVRDLASRPVDVGPVAA